MAAGRVTEVTGSSDESFDRAIQEAVERASQTLRNVKSAWVKEQAVDVEGGRITQYRVNLLITSVDD